MRVLWMHFVQRNRVNAHMCSREVMVSKAGIPRRRHRHRHPREDFRRHVRHVRFPEVFQWQAERHADILATLYARMSVSVSVSAWWNASLTASRDHSSAEIAAAAAAATGPLLPDCSAETLARRSCVRNVVMAKSHVVARSLSVGDLISMS